MRASRSRSGPSGPQRCTDAFLRGCASLADELDLQIHIHVLETRMQALSGAEDVRQDAARAHARARLPGAARQLRARDLATPHDIELVRDTGTTIVHNPISNMKLGSGICPVPELLGHGVNVALGTDGMSSNDGNDMFAVLKVAGLLHKLWDIDYDAGSEPTRRGGWPPPAAPRPPGISRARSDRGRAGAPTWCCWTSKLRVFTPMSRPAAPRRVRLDHVGRGLDDGRRALGCARRRVTGVDESAILAEIRETAKSVLTRHDEAFSLGEQLLASVRAGWLEALRHQTSGSTARCR